MKRLETGIGNIIRGVRRNVICMFINETDLSIAVKIAAGAVGIIRTETGILPGHTGPTVFSGRSKLEKPIAVRRAIVNLRIPA